MSENQCSVAIFDDLANQCFASSSFNKLATEFAHHSNFSKKYKKIFKKPVIFFITGNIVNLVLLQNLYYKNAQLFMRNCMYFILFKIPHLSVVCTLQNQLFGKDNCLKEIYKECMKRPYGYLLIDLTSQDPAFQFRGCVLDNEAPMILYRDV